eukprot:m.118865 g.118865  ORF g.118865 m.118865 type:complete len:55 (-) comp14294_c0_seq3:615-779(-)
MDGLPTAGKISEVVLFPSVSCWVCLDMPLDTIYFIFIIIVTASPYQTLSTYRDS